MSDDVRGLLDSREALYGRFADNAGCFVELSEVFGKYAKKNSLIMPPFQKLALIEILQKVARIANCKDESYLDNWQDIAGYAQLVVDEMGKMQEAKQAHPQAPQAKEVEPAKEAKQAKEAEQVVIKTQWVGGIPDTTLIEDDEATKARKQRALEAKRLARAKAKAARGASGNKKSTERKRAEAKARRIAREEAFKLLPPEVQKKRLADREYYKRKLAERQARLEAASKY